jgi:O-antigen ligase
MKDKLYPILLKLLAATVLLPIQITNIVIMLIGAYWLSIGAWKSKYQHLKAQPIALLWMALYGLFLLHGARDSYSPLTRQILETSLPMLVFPLIFASIPYHLTSFDKKSVLQVFVLANIAALIISLLIGCYKAYLRYHYGSFDPNFTYAWFFYSHDLSSHIGLHATHFSISLMLSLLVLLYQGFTVKRLNNILITICYAGVWLLAARTVIAIGTLFLAYYFLKKKKAKQIFSILIASLLLLAVLSRLQLIQEKLTLTFQEKHVLNTGEVYRNTRLVLWKIGWETFTQKPLFGVGVSGLYTSLEEAFQKYKLKMSYNNTHNQYLDFAVRFGITGFIAFLIVILKMLLFTISNKDPLGTFCILLLILSLVTESYLNTNKGLTIFFSICSFIIFVDRSPQITNVPLYTQLLPPDASIDTSQEG